MSERKLEIQVGIVFVLALTVLVLGVLWFKNYHYRAENVKLTVVFPKTSGLVRGDPVEVLGVPSGQVAEIRNEDGKALVILDLHKGVRLYGNARIVLENVGIMGQKLVAIYPGGGTGPVAIEGNSFEGEYQAGVTELMSDLGGTLDAFERIALRLDRVLASLDEGGDGAAGKALKNAAAITEELANFLHDSQGDLAVSVRNFRLAMEDIHQSLDGKEAVIGSLVDRTDRLTMRLDTTVAVLDTTLNQMQRIMDGVESGKGTFGKMMQDDALHEELLRTLQETRSLVDDIQKNPKKYVKLSLF